MALAEGWDVVVVPPPDAAERLEPPRAAQETLESYVVRLARAKGRAVADGGVEGTILACDTLSEVDGVVLGKPLDRDDARRMLELLSGRNHRVLTGVWLRRQSTARVIEQPPTTSLQSVDRVALELEAVEESLLIMDRLEPSLLDWYLDSGMWKGKAGGCGFQDERLPLRLVAGSGSNVVGLPLERIRSMLQEFDRSHATHRDTS